MGTGPVYFFVILGFVSYASVLHFKNLATMNYWERTLDASLFGGDNRRSYRKHAQFSGKNKYEIISKIYTRF